MSKGKIISVIIVFLYLGTAYIADGAELTLYLALFLILPISCIWFGDSMGSYIGPNFGIRPPITKPTPGCFVSIGGWILLFLPSALVLISIYNGK